MPTFEHRFGGIAGTEEDGGVGNVDGAVLTTAIATVGVAARPAFTAGPTVHTRPAIVALELVGDVLRGRAGDRSGETFAGVCLINAGDLDKLLAGIIEAAYAAGGDRLTTAILDAVITAIEASPTAPAPPP